jgi:DNA-binding beta-propeller fold protein YncE
MRPQYVAALCVALVAWLATPAARELNHPTGTRGLLLVDKLGAHVRFFDPRTFTELSKIPLPANPHDFALSPDSRFAYVPIYGDGVYGRNPHPGHEVYIIDLASRQVAGVIDTSPYLAPHAIQVDAAGLLYVASDQDRKLLVIDPARRAVTAAIDTEGTGHWIAMLPDGSKVYVANKNDKPFVSVIDIRARKLVARIPAANGTQGIAASPDGKRVVAMDLKEPRLILIDTATDAVVDQITLQGATAGGYKPYFSPDGKFLITMSLNSQVNIFDAANLRGEQTVLTAGRNPMGFAFSADGNTMLVANHGDGTVSVVDLRQRRVTGSFAAGTGIETLTYY